MSFCANAQITTPIKPNPTTQTKTLHTNAFYLGGGCVLSSVNIFRNYRQNPYRLGYNFRAYNEFSSNMRMMAEYTYMPKFSLEPTWLDVKNDVIDINLNLLAQIKDYKAIFYTITGLYAQRWKSFYTGINDFSNSKKTYLTNSIVINRYIGLDLGLGFERAFPGFQFFGEFRYRFSNTDSGFGITDAAYSAGLKTKLNTKRKKKYHGKYNWF
jgi:hypothetical protein